MAFSCRQIFLLPKHFRSVTALNKLSTSVHQYDYDLLVIGGGSGGLACAKEAASFGRKVALLDFVPPSPQGTTWGLGGTCVNVGCIPKKLMHQAALLGKAIKDSKSYGWSTGNEDAEHNWQTLVEAVRHHILSLNWGHRVQLKQKNVDYYNDYGSFVDSHTIETINEDGNKKFITGENVVIAVGGRPLYPKDIPGAREHGISSDDLFFLQRTPGKILVIGGSYVALECAGFLNGLGFPTTLMIRSQPLKSFDEDLAELVVDNMEREGVQILRQYVPLKIEECNNFKKVSYYNLQTHETYSSIWDTVLFATGRRAATDGLKLDTLDVCIHDYSGRIVVDKGDMTSQPDVYAIGDVALGRPELTPVAIMAGKLLANRLFNRSTELMNYNMVPTTVFTPLEYGAVGLSEKQAIEKYGEDNIEVYHAFYKPLEFYLPMRDAKHCYIKMVCVRDMEGQNCNEKVVGLHLTGPNAGEIIQGFAVALRHGISVKAIQTTIGIHPTSAEEVVKLHITKASGEDPTVTAC